MADVKFKLEIVEVSSAFLDLFYVSHVVEVKLQFDIWYCTYVRKYFHVHYYHPETVGKDTIQPS